MDVSTVRPKVAQLTFQLLGRSVHPELFHIYKSQRIDRHNYTAQLDITADGHVIRWTAGNATLTEVAASMHQLLPQGCKILATPLRNAGSDVIRCHESMLYKYEYELERVPSQMFWMIQQQLEGASKNHELLQVFDSSGRMAIGGLSFIHVDTRLNSLHVQAIHTFPDDLALVKTESTFSLLTTKT
ncbi:MAG: DUF2617 family protein [Planctomycetales bacterium]|nr:DUF2617 family protein [Planctomycetales bacterium]